MPKDHGLPWILIVSFFKLNTLENKMNLKEPPFEKDFFNKIN